MCSGNKEEEMTNPKKIVVEGTDVEFPVEKGDTILRAALRNGIGLPYDCNSGGCGSCQFELINGEIKDLWPEAKGISERARRRGRHLACQSRPDGDCTIKVQIERQYEPIVSPRRQTLRYVSCTQITHNMAELTFKGDLPADFLVGQYILLDIPTVKGSRAYSMSNLPNEQGEWRFIAKRIPGGAATSFLFEHLVSGQKIEIDGPYGMSYLRENSPRDIILIGGGSGISPLISIMRQASISATASQKKMLLFYGGREPQDLCANKLVSAYPSLAQRVSVVEAISDTDGLNRPEGTESGFIHDVVRQNKKVQINPLNYDYYFCGPPAMISAVNKMLQLDLNVPADQLYFDSFL
mgnify:CR=1 FL=1